MWQCFWVKSWPESAFWGQTVHCCDLHPWLHFYFLGSYVGNFGRLMERNIFCCLPFAEVGGHIHTKVYIYIYIPHLSWVNYYFTVSAVSICIQDWSYFSRRLPPRNRIAWSPSIANPKIEACCSPGAVNMPNRPPRMCGKVFRWGARSRGKVNSW